MFPLTDVSVVETACEAQHNVRKQTTQADAHAARWSCTVTLSSDHAGNDREKEGAAAFSQNRSFDKRLRRKKFGVEKIFISGSSVESSASLSPAPVPVVFITRQPWALLIKCDASKSRDSTCLSNLLFPPVQPPPPFGTDGSTQTIALHCKHLSFLSGPMCGCFNKCIELHWLHRSVKSQSGHSSMKLKFTTCLEFTLSRFWPSQEFSSQTRR